jgi:hypothetical protein
MAGCDGKQRRDEYRFHWLFSDTAIRKENS